MLSAVKYHQPCQKPWLKDSDLVKAFPFHNSPAASGSFSFSHVLIIFFASFDEYYLYYYVRISKFGDWPYMPSRSSKLDEQIETACFIFLNKQPQQFHEAFSLLKID